ncbi:uncharacterized protein LOC106154589 [Lingula anatina]|uniref:Uncharacterized protein LOC106154589 n=1 Tax=Lingula anatina TaxID=7574 RepID=A0A1S3HED8_LINAN|nr:uncharacterized protein LOC106154589 [Lingula anatina]|eukprot:XP_013384437.1 uncharacterized protein LOC106154589 [Lingula anatina]
MFWNSYYDPEECAYMRYDKSWQWNDFPCTDTYWGSHSYICEYVGEGSLDTSGGIYHGGSNVTEMALTMEPTTTTTTPEVHDGSAGRSGSDDRAQSESTVAPLLPHLTHFFSVAGFTIASILLVAVVILFGVYIVRKFRQAKTGDNQNTPLFHKSQPKQSVPISDYGSPIFL